MKKPIKSLFTLIPLVLLLTGCEGQTNKSRLTTNANRTIVGGGCDGCELMYVDIPREMNAIDTSMGWMEKGQKLIITGTIYQLDGKTPAPNVIMYYWHTNQEGLYANKKGLHEKARSHGYLRGWIKTDQNGKYTIHTIRPAPYPNDILPAHIHLSIKEPEIGNEYYAEDIVFDDDKLLINYLKKYPMQNRCGSGIVRVLLKDEIQIAEHDLVLGLNIPDYPNKNSTHKSSGLNIGEDQPSFIPFHAYGPDKGTQTCPVCKYGRYHGIIYFVGNNPDWVDIKTWLRFLENESVNRKAYLKVYFVYGNEKNYNKEVRINELIKIGEALNIKNVALTFVPSFKDEPTEAYLNRINPDAENTFIIYKHRGIVDKYIDLKPTTENFKVIINALNKTEGDFFNLPEPEHD
ncbi:MAG: intradiol ring-cleavage dioxygenase [Cytophagia bacterium]|nr:intradiol ring-cleavage dioxygenase [Cytophagia bacterium]